MAKDKQTTLGLQLKHQIPFALGEEDVELEFNEPNKKARETIKAYEKKKATEVTKLFTDAAEASEPVDMTKLNELQDAAHKKRFEMTIKDCEAKTKAMNFIDEYEFTYAQVNTTISTLIKKDYEKKLQEFRPM